MGSSSDTVFPNAGSSFQLRVLEYNPSQHGLEAAAHITSTARKQREIHVSWAQLPSPLIQSRTPARGMELPIVGSSSHLSAIRLSPPDMLRSPPPPGDSRCCHTGPSPAPCQQVLLVNILSVFIWTHCSGFQHHLLFFVSVCLFMAFCDNFLWSRG